MTDPYANWTVEDFHTLRASGSGCPGDEGGVHYFAFLGANPDVRQCIDCGEPEFVTERMNSGRADD